MAKKILIVEDDKLSIKLYSHFLEEEGYIVVSTQKASDALKMAKKEAPDLIIMDLMLQNGDGFTVIKNIRAEADLKKTPIIAMSNLGQDSDIKEALEKGANKYFVKSNVRFQEVVKTIKEMI